MIRQHWSNDLLEKIIFQRVYAPLYTCSWRKKRNSSFQNLRDGHVDQLGVGFRHGQGGHATAVPSERGERKRHPHSPGISSRQPRGHLGRNEDSVVVHVSLSLSRTSSIDRPFPSISHLGSPPSRRTEHLKSRILRRNFSLYHLTVYTLSFLEPVEGRASSPEVNSKSFGIELSFFLFQSLSFFRLFFFRGASPSPIVEFWRAEGFEGLIGKSRYL